MAEDVPGSPTGSASKKKPAQEGDVVAQRFDVVVPMGPIEQGTGERGDGDGVLVRGEKKGL
jgi:hypothetical protein